MINGAHVVIYSKNAEADRAFMRDVIGLSGINAGDGWLIFGLPPSELAVHPSNADLSHELYLTCDDIDAFRASMEAHSIECSDVRNQPWGSLVEISLPGGGKLGVYEPRHAQPVG